MTLKLADDQGDVLTSRSRAAQLRAAVDDALAKGQHVTLDFEGVEIMSPSFADELLAKLDVDALERGDIEISNFPASVRPLARYLAHHRRHVAP